MRRTSALLATLFAAAIALSPVLADARAGGGSSMGSRGSRTYSMPTPTTTAPSYTAPMERSMTPNAPTYAPSPAAPAPAPSYGGAPAMAGARSPFVSGLMGGLIGAGIGGLLFGHGLFGGFTGVFSFLGLLIQIFLVVLVVRWLFRLFAGNRQPAFAGAPGQFARQGSPQQGAPRPASRPAAPAVAILPADFQAFEQTLKDVQAAWSGADLPALQRIATPEMVSYFGEQLAMLASRGVRNTVTDVRLLQGDLSEAWAEGNRQYASVAMRFSMVDVTRDAAGHVVDGSPTESVTATEVWTFLRVPGGRWVLSAIQQAR